MPTSGVRHSVRDYEAEARALSDALAAGDTEARWRIKWEHPAFRDKGVDEVAAARLGVDDAQLVVARTHGFEDWPHLIAFTEAVAADRAVARFEAAADAIVSGDLAALQALLQEDPSLSRARSRRRHHATLLHYVAANGVEGARQRTPVNIVSIARALLDAGAEVDAVADMYGQACTTMSMLVSSSHPADAGVQGAIAELLVERGAALEGPGSKWQSALMTALKFGFGDTARTLVRLGARIETLPAAAGLGDVDAVAALLPAASPDERQAALALASQHGHVEAARLLLEAGESPDHYPPDFHAHSTPLHQAVAAGHLPMVRLLVDRGARRDIADTIYQATPYEWAIHGGRDDIAAFLVSTPNKARGG